MACALKTLSNEVDGLCTISYGDMTKDLIVNLETTAIAISGTTALATRKDPTCGELNDCVQQKTEGRWSLKRQHNMHRDLHSVLLHKKMQVKHLCLTKYERDWVHLVKQSLDMHVGTTDCDNLIDIAFFIADPILMTNMQWCWTLKCLRCSTSSGRKGWVSIWAKRLLKRCRPSVCLLLCHVFSESSMKLSHSVFHFTQPAACPSLFGPSVISHCGLSRKHRLGAFAMMKQSRHGCCPSIKLLLVTHLLLASCVLCILTMAITVAYMFSS